MKQKIIYEFKKKEVLAALLEKHEKINYDPKLNNIDFKIDNFGDVVLTLKEKEVRL